jgi:indolepyruvate ferredoxin oxidoreductase
MRTSARRCANSASPRRSPPRSACGSTRSACPGRWSRKACAIRGRLEEIFIVEERREIVENQVKQELFNWRDDVRPRIVGKMDEHDAPYFCSGCPHNTSRQGRARRQRARPRCRRWPASAATFWRAVDGPPHRLCRHRLIMAQMGGEGVTWIGGRRRSPSADQGKHVFANLGDGTYYPLRQLAIRQAVASAGVNITYKILYNDAVAMTGGQPVDGE